MAQSIEKRMTGVEYIIAHLPDDLNARFAGIDVEFASIREDPALAHPAIFDAGAKNRPAGIKNGST